VSAAAERCAAAPEPRAAHGETPATLREALPTFLASWSPRILLASLGAALGARLALGAWSLRDLLPVAVVLLYWPLQEWAIHVFLLHFRPRRVLGRRLDLSVGRKHRAHHRDPWNTGILFIPVESYAFTLPVLVAACFLIAPDARLALTALFTHLALTLHYEAVHFLIHTRVVPRTRFYRALWRNHRLHHFKNENFWYGVTRLEGDLLLRTAPRPSAVAASPTARELFGIAAEPSS
jgi:hypothetical protein